MNVAYRSDYMDYWVRHYMKFVPGQDYTGVLGYIQQRRAGILSQIQVAGGNTAFLVNGPAVITTSSSPITLTGTAPIQVQQLSVNGVLRPCSWTSFSAWSVQVQLRQTNQVISLVGCDLHGNPVPNCEQSIIVNYTGQIPEPLEVRINEWRAAETADSDPAPEQGSDWFELYNPSSAWAELGGCFLTDDLANPYQFEIPTGFRIPSGGFLLVWADGIVSANATNTASLHVPFKLRSAGEVLELCDGDGRTIDQVKFGLQEAGATEGRLPDGTSSINKMIPSPGKPNSALPSVGWTETTGSHFVLSFQALEGRTYRLEYKDDLTDPSWMAFTGSLLSSGAVTVPMDITNAQRFFRVVLLP